MSYWSVVDPSGDPIHLSASQEGAEAVAGALHRWWGFPEGYYRVEPVPGEPLALPPEMVAAPLIGKISERAHALLGTEVQEVRQPRVLLLVWSARPEEEEARIFFTEEELARSLYAFERGEGARLFSEAFRLPTQARDLDDLLTRAFLFAPRISRRRFPPRSHMAAWEGVPIAPGTSAEEARERGQRVLRVFGASEVAQVQVKEIRHFGVAHERALLEALDAGFWAAIFEALMPWATWGVAESRSLVVGVHHDLARMGVVATGQERYVEIPVQAPVWYTAAAYGAPELAQARLRLWRPGATTVREAVEACLRS